VSEESLWFAQAASDLWGELGNIETAAYLAFPFLAQAGEGLFTIDRLKPYHS
jgi:hypothetical protein